MARAKKTSTVVQKAQLRISGLKSINPKLDLGNGLDLATFEKKIGEVERLLQAYNKLLSDADAAKNIFEEAEKALGELNLRFLAAVKAVYGPNSNEYEKAGGIRSSDRKKPTRDKKV